MDLPVADPSVFNTCKLITLDDGLVRVNMSCTRPLPSFTSYVGRAKLTVASAQIMFLSNVAY